MSYSRLFGVSRLGLPRYFYSGTRKVDSWKGFNSVPSLAGEYRGLDTIMAKYIDIGANLLDPMYHGEYHGKSYHDGDLDAVLSRAWNAGMHRIIVTAGTLQEARMALELCRKYDNLYTTVGVHPTRGNEWAQYEQGMDAYLKELENVIEDGVRDGKVVAIGECGLDYDRLQFCEIETQKACFKEHFALSQKYNLPMFLHSRATNGDMEQMLIEHNKMMPKGGVVHSFDGSLQELEGLLQMKNIFIGLNGCSLKTEENLAVASRVPLSKLLLETDAPWCGIRATHASSGLVKTQVTAKDKKKHDIGAQVKGRNEPCNIVQICEVIATLKELPIETVAAEAYKNTICLFF